MIDKATNRELAAGLRAHLRETEGQVKRLQQAARPRALIAQPLTA
jgi:ferritin-like metal-binding protein YciE